MKGVVQRYYDKVRTYLPRRKGTYRGYVARDDRLFDITTSRPDYKEGVVRAIREYVPDQDVCIVGFGRGVTSIIALEGGAASIIAYEAAEQMIDIGLETFRLNDAPIENLSVEHALVGEAVDVFGSAEGASTVSPSELDPRDVLILDCEGGEISIISGLDSLPEVMIVESHPGKGATTEKIRSLMLDRGLEVETLPYEPRKNPKDVVIGVDK